mgnify:CR=1 FL=1
MIRHHQNVYPPGVIRSPNGKSYTYLELARTLRKNGKVYQERLCSQGGLRSFRGVAP